MSKQGIRRLRSLEVCAGAGGLSLGLERAGFEPLALLESKPDACRTLAANRPKWPVLEQDFTTFLPEDRPDLLPVGGQIDLLAAGLPRLHSTATVQRTDSGQERFLLRATVWLAQAAAPRAILIENIPGLVDASEHTATRQWVVESFTEVGYAVAWAVLDAHDFGVAQTRLQGFMVAMRPDALARFAWPSKHTGRPPNVADLLYPSMASRGWPGAERWASLAQKAAPTIVGGSDNRGGADLGPTGSKKAWARMGVNGGSIGDDVPGPDDLIDLMPKLTVSQVALLQGFPIDWSLSGRKTSAYRQIGNASPPPVGEAVGRQIMQALEQPQAGM
ncbi:DNA cytosine methyltransferase [Streptomyces sp. NPDC023998]|uniref:DNA cytosine methyltransferase n=1 Tax=Streptomyces sp. NPDC023998 TaxID=3154597 RepID=UPI0033DC9579